jgi:hypothetical protein
MRYVDFNFQLSAKAVDALERLTIQAAESATDEQLQREFAMLSATCHAQLTHVLADARPVAIPGRSGNGDWLDE